jgi:hypothetical protein
MKETRKTDEVAAVRGVHGYNGFVALVRLERPGGGFVTEGERITLDETTATVLLGLGFVQRAGDGDGEAATRGHGEAGTRGPGDTGTGR